MYSFNAQNAFVDVRDGGGRQWRAVIACYSSYPIIDSQPQYSTPIHIESYLHTNTILDGDNGDFVPYSNDK